MCFYLCLDRCHLVVYKGKSSVKQIILKSVGKMVESSAFWGLHNATASAHYREQGAALKEGHGIVFKNMLLRINSGGFDLALRWKHAKEIEAILERDILFFTFVEDFCKATRLDKTRLEDGGLEGIVVVEHMLASARKFPQGPGPMGSVMQEQCKAEHARIFGYPIRRVSV